MRRLQSFLSVILGLLFCGTAWAAEGANVSGTLVDAGGAPVAGAAVKLIYCEFTTGITGRTIGEATTDAEGKFLFAGAYSWAGANTSSQLPPRFCLLSTPAGSGVAYLNLQQGDASEGLRLQAGMREVVTVTVADTEGKPVADARVWLLHSMPKSRDFADAKQLLIIPSDVGGGEKTDAEGKADVVVPAGTQAMIAVEKAGYAMTMGERQFTLHRGGTVNGRVIGMDGKPAAGAKVTYAAYASQGAAPKKKAAIFEPPSFILVFIQRVYGWISAGLAGFAFGAGKYCAMYSGLRAM